MSDFNNDPQGPPSGGGDAATAAETPVAGETPPAETLSPAFTRFRSCRWQQPIENGSSEFCTHREIGRAHV